MAKTSRCIFIRAGGVGRYRSYSTALKVRRNKRAFNAALALAVATGAAQDRGEAMRQFFGIKVTSDAQ